MKTSHHQTPGAARIHSIYSKQARRWFAVLVGCIGIATAAQATVEHVALWTGNGDALDHSGFGNNGTLQNGASFGPGIAGQAFEFDGVDDYVLVPHSASNSFAGDFSISGWVNLADRSTSQMIITKGPTNPDPQYVNLPGNYELRVSPLGELEFGFEHDTTGYFFVASAVDTVPVGQWVHVAAVFTSATSVQLFINGAPAASAAHSFTVDTNTQAVQIGRRTGGDFHFVGSIDELSLFDRALSQAEVNAIIAEHPLVLGDPVVTELGATGSPVPGAGANGIPAGAVWGTFGVPSVNDAGQCAVLATYKAGTVSTTAILGWDLADIAGTMRVVAKKGDAVPSAANVILATLKDPMLAPDGSIAWLSTLANAPMTTGAVTSSNNAAIFLDADGAGPGGSFVVARSGDPAPGAGEFKAFTSVSLWSISDGNLPLYSRSIAFTATLKGAVTTANDSGLYCYNSYAGLLALSVREGDAMEGSTVKTITALVARPGSPGQGHGAATHPEGPLNNVLARIKLADNRQVLSRYTEDGGGIYRYASSPYATGESVEDGYNLGAQWLSFGLPTQESVSAAMAFVGTVKPKTGTATTLNNVAIFAESEVGDGAYRIVAKGDAADGIESTFMAFKDPVNARNSRVAFMATVNPNVPFGVTAANNDGIWATNSFGEAKLVVREGAQVPDAPQFTFWKAFTSLALPEGSGPIFTATLSGNLITTANDTGLWATDSAGGLRHLLQEGDAIGASTVKTFAVLGSVTGSPAQTRSFNNTGSIIVRATDIAGAQHLLHIAMP